jgi:predicted CXXCH cytochrome family protein
MAAAEQMPMHEPYAEGECDTCHVPHASALADLLTEPEVDLCGECHDVSQVPPEGGTVHRPIAQGQCVVCHQPHASTIASFLKARQRTLCVSCHQEVGENLAANANHEPAADPDGCLTCHAPHTAGHQQLLNLPVPANCLECHEGESDEFASVHLGLPATSIDCVSCHEPHASNLAGLLLPLVHQPFAEGDCAVCHNDSDGGRQ